MYERVISMGLFSDLEVTKLDIKCEKHGCQLWQKDGHRPICPLCQREKVKQKDAGMVKQFGDTKNAYIYRYKSYWGNPELLDASFENYKSAPGSIEEEFKTRALKLVETLKIVEWKKVKDPVTGEEKLKRILKPMNVIMSGDAGRGKSYLATCMLKEVLDSGQECLFINVPDYYEAMKDYWREGKKPKTIFRNIKDADLVVIDDLGAETGAEEASKFIQDFIYKVFNKRNRTIITTNLSSDDFYEKYTARNVSRMFEGLNPQTLDRVFNFKGLPDKRAYKNLF